jgi:hypothetical protein
LQVFLAEAEMLISIKSSLPILFLMDQGFGIVSKTITAISKVIWDSSYAIFYEFYIIAFTFMPKIHFECFVISINKIPV